MDILSSNSNVSSLFSNNKTIIIILILVLLLSFLGVNVLYMAGDVLNAVAGNILDFILQVMKLFGYVVGVFINVISSAFSTTTKTGIDIVDGALQSVGNVLIQTGEAQIQKTENDLNSALKPKNTTNKIEGFENGLASDLVQQPYSVKKQNWYLNDTEGRQDYILTSEYGIAKSNQPFPNQMKILQ